MFLRLGKGVGLAAIWKWFGHIYSTAPQLFCMSETSQLTHRRGDEKQTGFWNQHNILSIVILLAAGPACGWGRGGSHCKSCVFLTPSPTTDTGKQMWSKDTRPKNYQHSHLITSAADVQRCHLAKTKQYFLIQNLIMHKETQHCFSCSPQQQAFIGEHSTILDQLVWKVGCSNLTCSVERKHSFDQLNWLKLNPRINMFSNALRAQHMRDTPYNREINCHWSVLIVVIKQSQYNRPTSQAHPHLWCYSSICAGALQMLCFVPDQDTEFLFTFSAIQSVTLTFMCHSSTEVQSFQSVWKWKHIWVAVWKSHASTEQFLSS